MIIAGKYEVPDKCPDACAFKQDLLYFGQSSICIRCPVLNCTFFNGPDGEPVRLLEPEFFREDWAEEWDRFFKGGAKAEDEPMLYIIPLVTTQLKG